jgi:ferric-dicitrate binding protein FerR (iron transport regulator)
MPYKNPEDKRKWEQEHREQRNARRRQRPSANRATPDPVSAKQKASGWEILASIAVAIGLILLAAFAGASKIDSTHGSGNPE